MCSRSRRNASWNEKNATIVFSVPENGRIMSFLYSVILKNARSRPLKICIIYDTLRIPGLNVKFSKFQYSNVVNAFYSTPTCYTMAIKNISSIQWPEKYDDFFPYASDPHAYWTGYFTSKPAMKGLVRKSSSLLQVCFIPELSPVHLRALGTSTTKKAELPQRNSLWKYKNCLPNSFQCYFSY